MNTLQTLFLTGTIVIVLTILSAAMWIELTKTED